MTIQNALQLPKGGLILNAMSMQVSFDETTVVEAIKKLIENEDTDDLYTQAGVIARANPDDYSTTSTAEDAKTPESLNHSGKIESLEDAFNLPHGSYIVMGFIEATISREYLAEAANSLIENSDTEELYTKSEVVQRYEEKYKTAE